MQKFIFVIIILVFSVWLGLTLSVDPGLALFVYHHWLVQMPLWFAILILLILLGALYMIIRFFDSIDTSLYRCKNWLRWRKKNKAFSKTNRGLLELIEGDWINAENNLLDSIDQSDAPLINYLAAAKAAHERTAYDKRDVYLRLAYDIAPQAKLAIGITQAEMLYQQGQLEQALATLDLMKQQKPYQPVVLKLLERIYIHLSDWQSLLKLLPNLRKAKVLSIEQYEKLEEKIYEELITLNIAKQTLTAQEVWQLVPSKLQKNPNLIHCYARFAMKNSDMAVELDDMTNKILKKTWNAKLVEMYGRLETKQTTKQITRAEGWLKKYPKESILLLALGRLCVRAQLWGKARAYFEESLLLEANAEGYYDYAKLLEQLGDATAASRYYQQGLQFLLEHHASSRG